MADSGIILRLHDDARARGGEALIRFANDLRRTWHPAAFVLYERHPPVLDIGSGLGYHAKALEATGLFEVTTLDPYHPANIRGAYQTAPIVHEYAGIWACHVLEHQPDPNAFLRRTLTHLRPGGLLAVTVPPLKHEIVGGHVTLWNAGLLCYQLILAGYDCSQARVGTYGYNVSVIVQRPAEPLVLPPLKYDGGDIDTLARFFPYPVAERFDGRLPNIRW